MTAQVSLRVELYWFCPSCAHQNTYFYTSQPDLGIAYLGLLKSGTSPQVANCSYCREEVTIKFEME